MLLPNLQAEFCESLFTDSSEQNLFYPGENLHIYKHAIHTKLRHELTKKYPLTKKILASDFTAIAQDYFSHYPSRQADITYYGEYFGDFLLEHLPIQHPDYLPSLAKLEWICHLLTFAGDAENLNLDALANLDVQQITHLQFVLHPASQLMQADYPLVSIVENIRKEKFEPDLLEKKQIFLCIIRRNLAMTFNELTQAEFIFLENLSANQTLVQAFDSAKSYDPNFPLIEKLTEWIKDKTIVPVSHDQK